MEHILEIAGLSAAVGEKKQAYIPVYDTGVELPVTIINGVRKGKTVLITSGLHCAEYTGIAALIDLAWKLVPEQVSGQIIMVHPLNISGFMARVHDSTVAEDGKNLNLVLPPGNRYGSVSEQIVYHQITEFQSKADYYIDMHGGGVHEELSPYVYYMAATDEVTRNKAKQMAEAVNVPYMVGSMQKSPGLYNYAGTCGIPSILIERGCGGRWTQEEKNLYMEDIKNVLRFLGVLSGKAKKYSPAEVTEVLYYDTRRGGCWYPEKKAGEKVVAGEKLGEVRDCFGTVLETYRSERTGVILYQTSALSIQAKSPMIAYGNVAEHIVDGLKFYWSERSTSYSRQNVEEMNNWKRVVWRKIILDHAPQKECLKVLDVGTGPGFFAMNLALAGHQVSAVDVTEEMLEHARENAAAYGADVKFSLYDGRTLPFEENSFDLIVSRNVLWNIEAPELALQEWKRVLKPGGRMIYFDANWYLYLYDEEQKKRHMAAHENYQKLFPEELHNQMGEKRARFLEDIARNLPLSKENRPDWDKKVLSGMGMKILEIILNVGEVVWDEKEKVHDKASPLFMICAEKES